MTRPRLFRLSFTAAVALIASVQSPARARSHRTNERTGKLLPAFAELVKARKQGDRSALGRLGDRIGPARLAQAIAGPDARAAEAALAAAPLVRGGVLLVGTIADQTWASDPVRATAAAAALGGLLDGAVPSALEDWDVPPDQVALACWNLRALAGRKEAALPARLAALDAMLAAVPSCGADADLGALARDPAPEIRRAVVLVAAAGRGRAAALHEAAGDGAEVVRAAAAAAECRVEGRVGPRGKEMPPTPAAIAVARATASAAGTPPADAVEMLDCLAAAGTPADRALLDQLRRGPASPLRDRAVELGELTAPRAKGTE
ncbi:MAG TPA: hypothetical protein VKZ18_20675 [Polyangia bacterium]|nr:hypothetical protein [Polyangia bacterium]